MIEISIVVPVYNAEKYLSECIESIVNQTYPHLEIILVNDGSTDGSGAICDKYVKKDMRIKVVHQENKGPAYARYTGVLVASNEYVTFVDADDWLDLCTYEKAVKHIQRKVDMVTFGIIRYHAKGMYFDERNAIRAGEYNRKDIQENVIPTMLWDANLHNAGLDAALWNKIVRKELWLEQLEKAKELYIHYGEDVAVVYPMIMKMNHIVIMEECYYYHRQRPNGTYPDYLSNDEFYEKLYRLYVYLKEQLKESVLLLRQLEYFYLHAIEARLHIYGERRVRKTYTFPFDLVKKDSRVILYGAGAVGQEFYRQVKQISYAEIVLRVDQNYESYSLYDLKHPSVLNKDVEYDYIVIANASPYIAKEIRDYLLSMSGVDGAKIVWSE